jgi:hypothetical protein
MDESKTTRFWNKVGVFAAGAGVIVVILLVLGLIGSGFFRMFFVDFVENYQVAYRYDLIGENRGKIIIQTEIDTTYVRGVVQADTTYRHGWVVSWPIVNKIHTVDLRPMQLQLNANQRVLNAKLVQFDPKGLELFLSWHGRGDYEADDGRFSEILKSYAYDGNAYPFLKILRELGTKEGSNPLDGNAREVHVEKATPPQTEK